MTARYRDQPGAFDTAHSMLGQSAKHLKHAAPVTNVVAGFPGARSVLHMLQLLPPWDSQWAPAAADHDLPEAQG